MYNLQTIDETKNLFLSNSVDDLFNGIKSLHEVGKSADILKAGLLAKTRSILTENGTKKAFATKCEEFGLSKTSAEMYANNFLIAYRFVLDEDGNYIGIESKNPYLENFTISSLTEINTLLSKAIETDKLDELCDKMRNENCHYMTQSKLRKWRKDFDNADNADNANNAVNADNADNANNAVNADNADNAENVSNTTENESSKTIVNRPNGFIDVDGALLYDTLLDLVKWVDDTSMKKTYKEHIISELAKLFDMIPQ